MKKIFLLLVLSILLIPSKICASSDDFLKVKVGASLNDEQKIKITSKSNISVVDRGFNKIIELGSKEVELSYKDGKASLINKDKTYSSNFSTDGYLMLASDNNLKLKNEYRGYICFVKNGKSINVVNYVNIEDYLKGVVPKEIYSNAKAEALKAQAIVSRSFALSNINKNIKKGYNLDDTTSCQVYGGFTAEKPSTNKAVDDTKGQVVTYKGKIANTIFGASSGGVTADVSEVWGGNKLEYMTSFSDPYSDHPWTLELKKEDINSILTAKGIKIGDFIGFNIKEYDSSGRIKNLELIGTNGSKEISGNTFRSYFGNTKCKSTLFTISQENDKFILKGNGYGHGVGMSQYGAMNMAKEGKSCEDIIIFYFPNTKIESR